MGNIIITKYEKKLAAGIADMWNKSGDNWGGSVSINTEEDIIKDRENSTDLELFVALDGEEVVGTCSFARYSYDENTSYIPLLNVRPDYHGKKVGKKLVLEAVKMAIDSEWPRLDLFTWPGNTKAVPLYKKCGFFWEKMEAETHLMNFIPYVLKTEAVKDYFKDELDWYEFSQRKIEVVPDGDERGEFDFYQYSWEKDHKSLVMEFEKKGRGLCLIETDDYSVRVHCEKQKLVYGREYDVFYTVENKSGKELKIDIKGFNDKQIDFDMNESIEVMNKEVIKGKFKVNEITEEQNRWVTHPSIKSEVSINGKNAQFKLGIEPLFPIVATLNRKFKPNYLGGKDSLFLNLENSFDEKVELSIKLPENEYVDFTDKELKVNIEAKGKECIELPYEFKKEGFFNEEFTMDIDGEGVKQEYSKKLSYMMTGINGKGYGTGDENYSIAAGKNLLKVSKRTNMLSIQGLIGNRFYINYPKLGKPFSNEFSSKRAENVEYEICDDHTMMKLTYESDSFKGVKLYWINKLFSNGIVESYYEISSDKDIKEIAIGMDFKFSLDYSYIPYEGGVIEMKDDSQGDMEYYKSEKITENWMFSKDKNRTMGICWDKGQKIDLKEYRLGLNTDFQGIKRDEVIKTKSLYFALDLFGDHEEFRAFAMKDNNLPKLKTIDVTEIIVNDGNPFVDEDIKLTYRDLKFIKSDVAVSIRAGENVIHQESLELEKGGDKDIKISKDIDSNILNILCDTDMGIVEKEVLLFKKEEGKVSLDNLVLEGKNVLQVDNGLIKFSASAEYHNGIYSLEYKGAEYLDNQFPKTEAKGWFNPYTGGNMFIPEEAGFLTSFNEEKKCEFVEMKDQFDNKWSGIKTTLEFKENEKYKGLVLEQMYLTQYKQPVVITLYNIKNGTGKFLNGEYIQVVNFLDKKDNNIQFVTRDREDNRCVHKCNSANRDIINLGSVAYKMEKQNGVLNLKYAGADIHVTYSCVEFDVDNGFYIVYIGEDQKKNIGRSMMVFDENEISPKAMESLEGLAFEFGNFK